MKIIYYIFLLAVITTQVFTLTKDNLSNAKDSSTIADTKEDSWNISWPTIDLGSLKQKLGETISSTGQILGKTVDSLSQQANNIADSINIQDHIAYVRETAQPYAETVKDTFGKAANSAGETVSEIGRTVTQKAESIISSTNVRETISSAKESAQTFTKPVKKKFGELISDVGGVTKRAADIVRQHANSVAESLKLEEKMDSIKSATQPYVDIIAEKTIAHIVFFKEYTVSNVNMQDIELFMDVMSDFIPGATIYKKGGRMLLRLAQNTEDVTDLTRKLNQLITSGETKQAAREILQLIKRIGGSKDILKNLYNILRKE